MQKTHTPSLTRLATGVAALALAGSLAACGSSSSKGSPSPSASAAASTPAPSAPATSPSASATPTVKPTVVKDINAITVTPTTVGSVPKVTGKWPLAIASTQVKVLTPGSGAVVSHGNQVKVDYEGFNARTGKPFDGTFDAAFQHKTPATFSLSGVVKGFTKAIEGQKIGSRVVVFMTAADGYAQGQPSAGIQPGDNLVFVIDILGQAQPMPQNPALPKVTEDKNGMPVATIPKTPAPTTSTSELIRKGLDAKVTAKDTIMYGYRAWDWASGKLLEDSAANGTGQPPTGSVSALPAVMRTAIVGQPAGSRVMVVMTPKDLDAAAAAAGQSPSAKSTKTLVYVIDVLKAQAGA